MKYRRLNPRKLKYPGMCIAQLFLLTVLVFAFAGCDGDTGSPGAAGVDGIDGIDGVDGVDGTSGGIASWAGSATCEACHPDQYADVNDSGHPYKLVATNGLAPTGLPAGTGRYPAAPPATWEWSDIAYTIGGYGWKVRFVDNDGYIVTCEKDDVDADNNGTCDNTDAATFVSQYNIIDESWAGYHPGEYQKKYSCGACHTSGYNPDGDSEGGLPGIVGSWEEPGVRCEECHGSGSLHVADPKSHEMEVDRSSELCGSCHIRGDVTSIPASGGYIRHHEQWNEMFASTKRIMECIDCHDPHKSARYASAANPDKSIRTSCATCHFEKATNQGSATMAAVGVECIDCHMPYLTKSAKAAGAYTGDVRTHIFGINTAVAVDADYVDAEGKAMPYLTVAWACRGCHADPVTGDGGDSGSGSDKTDAELLAVAAGYHD